MGSPVTVFLIYLQYISRPQFAHVVIFDTEYFMEESFFTFLSISMDSDKKVLHKRFINVYW